MNRPGEAENGSVRRDRPEVAREPQETDGRADAEMATGSLAAEDANDRAVEERRILLGAGYRMLGTLTDAEDAVQETYVRWYRLSPEQRSAIRSPRAWLVTVISRVCLDMLGSARARRERYVGEWLPEPLPAGAWNSQRDDPLADPGLRVTVDESISMALLVVLEVMTPAERVSFVLHDVFRFTFPEIAEIVGRSPAACRQLAVSARSRVRSSRAAAVAPAEHRALVRSFKKAWETGDLSGMVAVLDPEVTVVADGGGLVGAALAPIRGVTEVAAFLLGILDIQPGLVITERPVNGDPGVVTRDREGRLLAVIALAPTLRGLLGNIWVVRNPDKLAGWDEGRAGDWLVR